MSARAGLGGRMAVLRQQTYHEYDTKVADAEAGLKGLDNYDNLMKSVTAVSEDQAWLDKHIAYRACMSGFGYRP